MLKIVEYIEKHPNDWRETLAAAPYFLKIKEKGDLVLFNYNQIDSDPYDEIVKEARGLILDKDTLEVVRYGFRRFMNLGEVGCDQLDWESVGASSKEDGTLIFIYYYGGWHVGTRSTFDAEEAEISSPYYKNFRELFDEVAAQYGFKVENLPLGYTFCLELCSPSNRVVVEYKEPKLFHILTRDNATLQEVSMDIGLPKPKMYMLSSEKDYRELVESFDETHEGIVLKDAAGHRAKLKSKLYFDLHRLACNNQITAEIALEKIISGEDSEFLTYFNQWIDYFNEIDVEYRAAKAYVSTAQKTVNLWKSNNPDGTRKDFAAWLIQSELLPQVLFFKAYDNKAEEWFNSLTTAQMIKLFNIGREIDVTTNKKNC